MYFSFLRIKLKFSIEVTMFSNLLASLQTSLSIDRKLLTIYSSMLASGITCGEAKSVTLPEFLSFESSEIRSIVLSKSPSVKRS